MTILGIDPGSRRIGYGIIEKKGGGLIFIEAGLLGAESLNSSNSLIQSKLHLSQIIKKFKPGLVAIEKLYFAKNQKTALGVAENRGVIILTATELSVPVREYSPSEVKAKITGYGAADKKSVAKMVRLTLKTPSLKTIDDASDALAIAIVASQEQRLV